MILHVPITRLRAPLVAGSYGNSIRDWASASSQVFLVNWSARAVSEVVGDEPQTVSRIKVFGDAGLDLEATDRVVGPDGATYEVDGQIMQSYRRGVLHHVRAFLRKANIAGS